MFEEIFDCGLLPQLILDVHGRVLRANARFVSVFGTEPSLAELFSNASPCLMRLVAGLYADRRPFEAKDVEVRLGSGRLMTCDASGTHLPASGHYLVVLVDSTDRVSQAASRVQRARSETIAQFAGGLAHDLNNLLAAIVATSQAGTADAEEGSGDAASDFRAIIEEAERGATLARSLRALALDEAGGSRPVSLATEIRAAAAGLERGQNAIRLDLDLSSNVSDVVGDRARLRQLVLNLLVNARDATIEHEGAVDVILRPTREGGVEFIVADRGPGVPAELRDRVFQPYFTTKRRPDDSDAGPGWGTGLGLAIVDAVAHATGATVAIGDRAGGGAEFRVIWPPAAVAPEPVEASSDPSKALAPALVLLADNEVTLVGAVARQLRRLGHSVYAAMSAEECRRLFDQYRDTIDVALLDVKLGDGDGRELAEFFRSQRPDLAVVLMSASRAALGPPEQAARSLVKPFDVRELTLAIERARAHARARARAR